jgi:hypothetical protein
MKLPADLERLAVLDERPGRPTVEWRPTGRMAHAPLFAIRHWQGVALLRR